MKSKITITVDEDVLKRTQKMADEESRNISNQINKILKDFFEKKDE